MVDGGVLNPALSLSASKGTSDDSKAAPTAALLYHVKIRMVQPTL